MSSFRKASTPLGRGVGTFSRVTRERSHYCKLHTTHIQLVHILCTVVPQGVRGELYYSNGSSGAYCIHTNVYTGEGYMVQGEALVWQQQQTQTRQKNDSKNGCSPAKLS